ncbi:MAG: TraB/GumN family protein [Chitinophagales bacterium]
MQNSRIFFFVFVLFYQVAGYSQSLCWKISMAGAKNESYVFGTMHSTDARVFKLSKGVEMAMENTAVFVNEMDMENLDMMSIMQDLINPKNSLKKALNKEDYALLDSMAQEKLHLPLSLLDNIQPILISSLLETSSGETKDTGSVFLDLYLAQKSRENHKTVKGLETAAEQLKALNALSYEDQIDLLVKTLHEEQKPENDFERMIDFYVKGKIDSLLAMSEEAKMPPRMMEELVIKRNKRMADRMEKMFAETSHFFTVGALHLPGEKGVLNLLRKKGFIVTPVL